MSSALVILTRIRSSRDVEMFSTRLLPSIVRDGAFKMLSRSSGIVWKIQCKRELFDQTQALAQWSGMTFDWIDDTTATGNESASAGGFGDVEFLKTAQELSARGNGVVMLHPRWNPVGPVLRHVAFALQAGAPSYRIPVVSSRLWESRRDPDSALWDGFTPPTADGSAVYVARGTLFFRLSPDHLLVWMPLYAPFYLAPGALEVFRDWCGEESHGMSAPTDVGIVLCEPPDVSGETASEDSPRQIPVKDLSQFLDDLCLAATASAKSFARFLQPAALLVRPDSVEALPDQALQEVSFLMLTLGTRVRGYVEGCDQPRQSMALPAISASPIKFSERKKDLLPQRERSAIPGYDDMLREHAVRLYRRAIGVSTETMMHETILKRLRRFLPAIRARLAIGAQRIAVYGAGGHTRLLLEVWRRLEGGAIDTVLVSGTPSESHFESIPIRQLSAELGSRFGLVVLSSATYEREMARTCAALCPQVPLLTFWHPELTTLQVD